MIVHDSVTIEIPRVESEFMEAIKVLDQYYTTEVQNYITNKMGFKFSCPLDVDIGISQPRDGGLGSYGYGTCKDWDWSK